MPTQHLLVTGGGGFVMSHLVNQWLTQNLQANATILDSSEPDEAIGTFLGDHAARYRWVVGDVCDSASWAALSNGHFDHIVHGATVTSIVRLMAKTQRIGETVPAMQTNIIGTMKSLDFAQKQPHLKRLIYVSSGSVYADTGPGKRPQPEDTRIEPDGLYGISKYTSELLTQYVRQSFGLPCASVRLSGVFGPMDRQTASRDVHCVPQIIAQKALLGEPITIRSLDAVGDFIHAEDVARAIVALLQAPALHAPVYNIAHGQTTSIRCLLEIAEGLIGRLTIRETNDDGADINYPLELNTGRWGAYDLSRITSDTDWQPRAIEESFGSYIEWLRSNPPNKAP